MRAWCHLAHRRRQGDGLAIVFVDRFVGLLALMLFAALGLARLRPAPGGGAGPLRLGAGGTWGWGPSPPPLSPVSRRRRCSGSAPFPERLAGSSPRPPRPSSPSRGKEACSPGAFGWSLVIQTRSSSTATAWRRPCTCRSRSPYFFLIVPLALFVMMLPVSINAIGVRENVFAFFFAAFCVASATSVAVAWLDYGLVLAPGPGGRRGLRLGEKAATQSLPAEEAARENPPPRPPPFLPAAGDPDRREDASGRPDGYGYEVDVLTFHEGEDPDIPGCRIHRIPRPPGPRCRPGFSAKKLVCDAAMLGSLARWSAAGATTSSTPSRSRPSWPPRPAPLRRPLRLRHGLGAGPADGRPVPPPERASSKAAKGGRCGGAWAPSPSAARWSRRPAPGTPKGWSPAWRT